MNEATQIKVMTFNLLNYLAPPDACYDFENIYSATQWRDKQRWTAGRITASGADIIGFQEIFSIEPWKQQMQGLGYPFVAVVDSPRVEEGFIFSQPVVGIASRFPIRSVVPVKPDEALSQELDFCYSRTPIHAEIEIPHFGILDCIVVHLKSQRGVELTSKPGQYVQIERWRATMQRGLEARSLLCYLQKRRLETGCPQLLMGDMNHQLDAVELQCLTDPESPLSLINSRVLIDSGSAPVATHYYGAKGSELDYILLSEEFEPECATALFSLSDYEVFDQHLVSPVYARDYMASDHATVAVTLTPIPAS